MSAAQAPAEVTITLGPRSVAIGGGEGVTAGPTRMIFRNSSRQAPQSAALAALRPGVTLAQLRAAVARAGDDVASIERLVSFEAGGSAPPGGAYTTTIELKPNTTYVAANVGERPQDFAFAQFTTGAAADPPRARPTPVATVGLYDYAFGMPATLPRNGVVRFENRGEQLHIAVAFPLRRGRDRVAAVRAFLRNQERRIGPLIREREITEPQGIVSSGAVNDVELSFPRAGDYVMVCFIEDGERGNPSHNTIGMVKAFTVR